MSRQFSGVDAETVKRVVDRCSTSGVDQWNALGTVVQTAHQHDIELTHSEEGGSDCGTFGAGERLKVAEKLRSWLSIWGRRAVQLTST
jgi:hypothetical protein